jgi:nucleoside-diphosphate-sugar epimerase
MSINLVIGDTSQQSHYYPNDFVRISSRNIDFEYLKNNNFDSVFITFAEQRIYDNSIDYIEPNYTYTLKVINQVLKNSKKVVVFTSCELWSNLSGVIDINTLPSFNISNQYTLSKLLLLNEIKRLRKINSDYNKVVILNPFYFNSVYRKDYFLFGKIFDSIINKKRIQVGNLNFYRDMVHTSFLVKKAIELNCDSMVGSGRLFNVRDFVIDLYNLFDMKYCDFVTEDLTKLPNDKLIRADVEWSYTYSDLINDTYLDIKKYLNNLNPL